MDIFMMQEQGNIIAALATPPGKGGIAIVRVSGAGAIEQVAQIFKGKADLTGCPSHTVHYGKIWNKEQILDEVLVTVMRAPHTFTGEDTAEINCHGSGAAVREILSLLLNNGVRMAGRGEFTKRAFLNGRMDLSQAEAVMDVIQAESNSALHLAVNQLEGKLSACLRQMRETLLHQYATVQAEADFPEEGLSGIDESAMLVEFQKVYDVLNRLKSSAKTGRLVKQGIQTVLCGTPNAGKSSLLNALVGENRAIVTEVPGTTRDCIEEYVELENCTLRLLDTAGIRETEDKVEQIGVDRAKESMQQSDLVLFVADCSRQPSADDQAICRAVMDKPVILVLNKQDVTQGSEEAYRALLPEAPFVAVSAKEKHGMEALSAVICELFQMGAVQDGQQTFLTNMRHVEAVGRAAAALGEVVQTMESGMPVDMVFVDLQDAISALGEVTGETVQEEVVDKIFSEFCVGK